MNQSNSPVRKPAMQFWAPMGANGERNPAGEFGRITPDEAREAGRNAARNLMRHPAGEFRQCTPEEAGEAGAEAGRRLLPPALRQQRTSGGKSAMQFATAGRERFRMLRPPEGTTPEQVEAGARVAALRLMRIKPEAAAE